MMRARANREAEVGATTSDVRREAASEATSHATSEVTSACLAQAALRPERRPQMAAATRGPDDAREAQGIVRIQLAGGDTVAGSPPAWTHTLTAAGRDVGARSLCAASPDARAHLSRLSDSADYVQRAPAAVERAIAARPNGEPWEWRRDARAQAGGAAPGGAAEAYVAPVHAAL